MRTTSSALWYQTRVYLRNGRYFLPFALYLVFLAVLNSSAPVHPVSGYAFSMTVWFFVMCWMGFTFSDMEDPVTEQLLILKLRHAGKYYVCQCVFLALAGMAGSLVAALFPLLVNVLGGFAMFSPPITLATVLQAFLLHTVVACMAGAAGSLLHPRILPNRKVAGLLLLLIALVGFVTPGILKEWPLLEPLLWLFPPIWLVSERLPGGAAFPPAMWWIAALYLGYGLVLSCIKTLLLLWKKY